jgi:hypothetical protein
VARMFLLMFTRQGRQNTPAIALSFGLPLHISTRSRTAQRFGTYM